MEDGELAKRPKDSDDEEGEGTEGGLSHYLTGNRRRASMFTSSGAYVSASGLTETGEYVFGPPSVVTESSDMRQLRADVREREREREREEYIKKLEVKLEEITASLKRETVRANQATAAYFQVESSQFTDLDDDIKWNEKGEVDEAE